MSVKVAHAVQVVVLQVILILHRAVQVQLQASLAVLNDNEFETWNHRRCSFLYDLHAACAELALFPCEH